MLRGAVSVIMTAMFVLGMLLIGTSAAMVVPRLRTMEAHLTTADRENAALARQIDQLHQQMATKAADIDRLMTALRALYAKQLAAQGNQATECPKP